MPPPKRRHLSGSMSIVGGGPNFFEEHISVIGNMRIWFAKSIGKCYNASIHYIYHEAENPMRNFKRMITLGLLLVLMAMLALPVAADTYVEHQGLQVSVKMDKEHYEEGETITATITVYNVSTEPVTIVNLEQLIPEGYRLIENSVASTRDVEILPGQTIEMQVTFEGDPAQSEGETQQSFWDKLFYGETLGIPNILLAVILVIGIIVFMLLT